MIQIKSGDLISIEHNDEYFYAFVVTNIKLRGGNLVYAFYKVTKSPLRLEEVLSTGDLGFMTFVDLIQFKRAGTITRLGRNISIPGVEDPEQYKQTWPKRDDDGYFVRLFDNSDEYLGQYDTELKSDLPPEILELPEYATYSGEFLILNIKRKWHQSQIESMYIKKDE